MSITKKIQVDENRCKYILLRIDVYFTEYILAVETDEKYHTSRDFIIEEERQEAIEKILGCKFIRSNTSKEGYDTDYEASRIQTFISKFKDMQLKKLDKKIKALEDKIEKLTGQITQENRLPNYRQLRNKTTLNVKITPILKPIKTDYKTWTFIVKTAKNTLNVQIQKN